MTFGIFTTFLTETQPGYRAQSTEHSAQCTVPDVVVHGNCVAGCLVANSWMIEKARGVPVMGRIGLDHSLSWAVNRLDVCTQVNL